MSVTTPDWRRVLDRTMAVPERVYEHWASAGGWDNDTEFGREYGENFVSWCVIFLWDMCHDVGLDAVVPKTDNVTAFTNWAKARGQWSEYPSIGAWTNFSDGAHTEMVTGFTATTVRTKGGNSVREGSTDAGQGDGVWSHTTMRTSPRILGYFAPRFPDGQCPPTADPHDPRGGTAVASYTWTGPVVISGVDVADYQPAAFSTAGLDFAVIKLTEGTWYVNPKWAGQRATAKAAGLVTGFYHFGRPGSMTAQVDYFLSKAALAPGDFLAFDWEDTGITSAEKDAWIRYCQSKAPGHRVILYCNKDFWLNRDVSSFVGDGLWIATGDLPAGSPGIEHPWLIHQYSSAGGADHDVAQFTSRAAMQAWAGSTEGDPPMTPAEIQAVAAAVWNFQITSTENKLPHGAGVYVAYSDQHFAEVRALVTEVTAKVDALAAVVAELAATVSAPDELVAKLREFLASVDIKIVSPS